MADILATDEGIAAPPDGRRPDRRRERPGRTRGPARTPSTRTCSPPRRRTSSRAPATSSNGGTPLSDATHGAEIITRQHDTILKTRAATVDGAWNTDDVVGGISNDFWGHPRAGAMKFMACSDSMVRKNFTASNLGVVRHSIWLGSVDWRLRRVIRVE